MQCLHTSHFCQAFQASVAAAFAWGRRGGGGGIDTPTPTEAAKWTSHSSQTCHEVATGATRCSCRGPDATPLFLSVHNIKVVLKNLVETESALKYSLVVYKSLQRNQMSQLTKMPQIVTNAITIFTKSRTLTPLGPKLQSKAKTW